MNSLFEKRQLPQLILTHFHELFREPGVLFWGIIFPILMSLGLGIAFTKKPDVVRNVAVITESRSIAERSDQLAEFLKSNAEFVRSEDDPKTFYRIILDDEQLGRTTFIFKLTRWEEALTLLKQGNVSIVLDNKNGEINYHLDPANPDGQLNYLKLSALFEHGPDSGKNSAAVQALTLPGTRYIDFLLPGLIAMGLMMACMWGLSYGMIDRRSKKLLRRMIATPMKKSYFLIAIIFVRFTMNFIEALLLFVVAWLVFGITIQGNTLALLLLFVAGNIAFAGIAILFSSRTANTEIGNGLVNAVVMPMMVMSGVFFSYHNFPDWLIPYIQMLPLTMLADGMRSIFIEGAGFAEIMLPSAILTVTGIVFFTAGLKIYKWH
jgi:ABC-2 type transport system permease protein